MRHLTRLMVSAAMVVSTSVGWAQRPPQTVVEDIAVVSPPPVTDPTGSPPLVDILTRTGEKFTDVTSAVRAGKLDLARVKVLMIGSGSLSHEGGRLADVLADGRKLLAGFVESGGVLVVFTGPTDVGKLRFLPDTMAARIVDVAHEKRTPVSPAHPLLLRRHRLTSRDLGGRRGTLYPGGCYGPYDGLAAVVAWDTHGRYPIILEGPSGRGRVLLIHLCPDRAFAQGTADEKVSATLLLENVLTYVREVLALRAPEVKLTERVLRGVVFEDTDGDGLKGPAEKVLTGAEVTDGAALVKTDATGAYVLPLDVYSEFVWVNADFAKYKGPLWRAIPADTRRVDVAVAPREKPFGSTPRVVTLVDVGSTVDPGDGTDPALSWMLDEAARLEPKPDVLVIYGDARACELRRKIVAEHPAGFEVVHRFVPVGDGTDVVAERDAFTKVLGPDLKSLRLHAKTHPLHDPSALMHLTPAGATLSFRKGGLRSPPALLIEDVPPEAAPVPEVRLAGFRNYLHAAHPGLEAVVAPGPLLVSFVLGDTALGADIPVKVEMAHVRREKERLVLMELALPAYQVFGGGPLTRRVTFEKPVILDEGFYVLRFTAGPPQASWSRNVSFVVPKGTPPGRGSGSPWPAPGGNSTHTGQAADNVSPPFHLAGVVGTGWRTLRGSPVVLADAVLVPVEGNLTRTGSAASGVAPGLPTVREMHVPFCCHEQGVFELHPGRVSLETAEKPPRTLRFDFTGPGPNPAATHMVVGGECLCVVDAEGTAWGFVRTRGAEVKGDGYDARAAAESLRWQVGISPGCRQAVATDAELFTGNECLEIASGKPRWTLETYRLRDCSVALSGERVVVTGVTTTGTSTRQVVLVIERETGKLVWEKVLAEVHPLDEVLTAPPAVARGAVFVGSADGVFRALALADGVEAWQFKTGDSVIPLSAGPDRTGGRISSGAVVSDRTVFFGAADGGIYALERRRGTLTWHYNVGLPVLASLALSGNTLYVADWAGNLYTFVSLVEEKK